MSQEPIGLYIFRFIVGIGILIFLTMLYWSSTIQENSLKELRSDLAQLKNDMFSLRLESEKIRGDLIKEITHLGALCASKAANITTQEPVVEKKNSDNVSVNLLQNDPFFEKVLPELLGENFKPLGIQRTASIGKPDNLHPFSNWSQVSAWRSLCNVSLSKLKFGIYETMTPDMALRIEERINAKTGVPEFWVFLRDNVFWEPLKQDFFPASLQLAPHFLRKNQVTSDDFKFFMDALMNPYVEEPGAVALRTYYSSLDEIEIIDKLTFVVRWKAELIKNEEGKEVPKIKYIARDLTGSLRPLASFLYKYFSNGKKIVEDDSNPDTYRTNSVWAQNFSTHWAKNVIPSCGPWKFDSMNERQIKFVRNENFYFPDAALTSAMEIDFKDNPENAWLSFKNDQLQSYNLQPDQLYEFQKFLNSPAYLQQKAQGNGVNRLDFVSRVYAYIGWNEAKPYFNTAKVRKAMTMAIDRQRIIEQNLNGLGIETTGTFYRFSPAYDPSIIPLPFNPHEARRMLEEEGWYDSDGDGIIDKLIDGKRIPFSFQLTYYVKNSTSKSICEYVCTAMKEIGVDCHLNGVDIADLSAVFDDKGFDALCMAWALGTPPENPRQLWSSAGAKEKGSSNAVGFANAEIDAIIDKLDYEYDPAKRIELYHRFDAILYDEQPYTFLYTPKTIMVYRDFLQNVFLPIDRQDLVPGANIAEPDPSIYWIRQSP